MAPAFLRLVTTKVIFVALVAFSGIFGIVVSSLILGGCTSSSPGIPSFYLLRITNGRNGIHVPEVRLGYLGLCVTSDGGYECTSRLSGFSMPNNGTASAPFVYEGQQLIRHVFSVAFEAVAAGLFVVAALLAVWHLIRVKQTGRLATAVATCFVLSAVFQCVALVALWYATQALKLVVVGGLEMDRGLLMFWSYVLMAVYSVVMILPSCRNLILSKLGRAKGGGADVV